MTIAKVIEQKLSAGLTIHSVDVVNESHRHNVPHNSETHFKLTVVATEFSEQRAVQRHQAIYALLAEELAGGVHALAIHAYSPDEWASKSVVPDSPNCLGG